MTSRTSTFGALVAAMLLAAGCAGRDEPTRVYFVDGYRSTLGMRGHLVAVERDLADRGLGQIVAEVLRGPTSDERERGLVTGFAPGVTIETVTLSKATARINLRDSRRTSLWPGEMYATAQLVYTLTELDGVRDVVLLVNGRRCCVYDMRGRPWPKPLDRRVFAGWQGTPLTD
jgi:spore germination protein GerM